MKKIRFIVFIGIVFALLVGVSFAEIMSTAYLVTTSSSVNHSDVHIINTSDIDQSFTGTLYNRGGNRLGAPNVTLHSGTIPAQGRLILTPSQLEGLFGVAPWTDPAMLEVTGSADFKVMIKLKSPSGFISNSNCVTEDSVHNIEGFDKAEDSYIRFINTSDTTINSITGSLYDNDGNLIGSPNQVLLSSLGPKEQVWLNRYAVWQKFDQIFWYGEASLVLNQDYPNLKMLMLNFVNSETFFNFSCYEDTRSNPNNWEFAKTSPAGIDTINDWVEESAGVYSATVSGANGFSNMITDTIGDGLQASLKVQAAYCPSYCMARLDRFVGYYNGNPLRVELRLGKWGNNHTIEYRVRETDLSGNSIREIARGYWGASEGQHWAFGETVDLTVGLEGNEFIFYANNKDQITKLKLLGPITPFDNPKAWRINIWTETANDSMTATASGFMAVDLSE